MPSAPPNSASRATASLDYRPRSRALDEDEFVAELQARLAGDLERGFSTHGPHRDELASLRDGRELRLYGSQGEQRLALLALLLAERTVLARERGRTPLMLLDDVMSELDSERRELLARELSAGGQSVIATTDLAHVPGAGAPGSRDCECLRARSSRRRWQRENRSTPSFHCHSGAHGHDCAGDHPRACAGDLGAATGAAIAAAARPTAERDGILTVTCAAAVWAQELDLMAVELVQSLNAALGEDAIRELRCRTG